MIENLVENERSENEKLEALKQFMKVDLDIKDKLIELSPSDMDDFDESTRIAYVDKVYKCLKEFEYQFQSSLKGFKMEGKIEQSIKKFFEKLKENLVVGSFEKGICKNVYQRFFSDMSKGLIEGVKKRFVGYTEYGEEDLDKLIGEAVTVNELLHICHSYVMNNENILNSITKLDEKKNDFGYPIRLYGEKSEISEELFKRFPIDLDVGYTDIIAVQDQILLMVRDRGHALTLNIDTSHDKMLIKYFIPKICNEDMVRALPGVDKKNLSINGASGSFECEKHEFTDKLLDFIGKVPTDGDMPSIKNNLNGIKFSDDEKTSAQLNNEDEPFFSLEDVRELTMREGENGRKLGKIRALEYRIKQFYRHLKDKINNKKEENKDEI